MKKKKINVIILRTAGTNCDNETKFAFQHVGANADLVHINKLISDEIKLDDYHILAVPGGFTYGDDIAAGTIVAVQLMFKLKKQLQKFIKEGKIIIGICNGFQILVKSGILPGWEMFKQQVSLVHNNSEKFEDRWVYLRPDNRVPHRKIKDFLRGKQSTPKGQAESRKSKCVWTKGIKNKIYLPVAHAEGKFVAKNKEVLDKLKQNNQIVFQYVNKKGEFDNYPYNPNGSQENIAAICDESGRVLGIMPHPERNILPHHHPRWTRRNEKNISDGLEIFKNGVNYIKGNF